MSYTSSNLHGIYIYSPKIFKDDRGYFFESFNMEGFEERIGHKVNFVQDNQSFSKYGTLRGLHFQKGSAAQAKLVRVLSGKVLDVVVDLRPDSPTYRKSLSVEISDENKVQMFVPRGFAHGFVVLSESASFFYKCDNYYDQASEGGIYYADPELNIDWKIPHKDLLLSDKDMQLPFFNQI